MYPDFDAEKKIRIQREELDVRDQTNLKYGENTETLTFAINRMTDFVIKPTADE